MAYSNGSRVASHLQLILLRASSLRESWFQNRVEWKCCQQEVWWRRAGAGWREALTGSTVRSPYMPLNGPFSLDAARVMPLRRCCCAGRAAGPAAAALEEEHWVGHPGKGWPAAVCSTERT